MLLVYLWLWVLAVGAVQPEIDTPYCTLRYRRLCQGKGRHVACQFPTEGPGESCLNYTMIKFTKNLRNFVTHYINRRRQRLAAGNERVKGGPHVPRPEIMMQVEWDRELALLAQRLADQCSFVHDDCRATVRYPYAGQTVGEVKWRRSSESDQQNIARSIRKVLDAWWGERRRVTVKQLTQPFRLTSKGNVWGHFSQLAVWTLRAVGCGAVRHGIKYPRVLLVCDFSHTNMLGQRTIVPGQVAPCPIHTMRRPRSPYPLLCGPVRIDPATKEDKGIITSTFTSYDAYEFESTTGEGEEDDYNLKTLTAKVKPNMKTVTMPAFEATPKEREKSEGRERVREREREKDRETEKERDSVENTPERNYERKQPPPERNRALEIIRTSDAAKGKSKQRERPGEREKSRERDREPEREREMGKERHATTQKTRQTMTYSEKEKMRYDVNDPEVIKQKYDDFNQIMYKSEKERPLQLRPMQVRPIVKKVEQDSRQRKYLPGIAPSWYLESGNTNKKGFERPKSTPWSEQEYRQRAFEVARDEVRSRDDVTEYYEPVRHRWRPTRDRPDRPGAKALLSSALPPATGRLRAAKKSGAVNAASLMIDKDDVEQLIKDTGFNPSWNKKNQGSQRS